MALTPEQQARKERLHYWQAHIAPAAAVLGIIYGLYRLYPIVKKHFK
jgi:hypothetical protein